MISGDRPLAPVVTPHFGDRNPLHERFFARLTDVVAKIRDVRFLARVRTDLRASSHGERARVPSVRLRIVMGCSPCIGVRATAVVLFGLVLSVNLVSIGFRVYLRSRKRW